MTTFDVMFYVLAGLTLFSAAVMVFSKNIIYNAIGLLFALFGIAGVYVLLGADFIAATQLLIYVGGILVLLLFGVMLSQRITGLEMRTGTLQVLPASLVCAAIVAILIRMIQTSPWKQTAAAEAEPTTRHIGNMFMTDYLIPFEIVSVLLLAALVGAAFIGRRGAR
ncbi:MAG: NADH-quinone oxidoreductase subunit J [candidate division KSB1 bacterium]|nr:NADH-quinone oxidoreductase subunit J [candidate division KSB1 bacterium]